MCVISYYCGLFNSVFRDVHSEYQYYPAKIWYWVMLITDAHTNKSTYQPLKARFYIQKTINGCMYVILHYCALISKVLLGCSFKIRNLNFLQKLFLNYADNWWTNRWTNTQTKIILCSGEINMCKIWISKIWL